MAKLNLKKKETTWPTARAHGQTHIAVWGIGTGAAFIPVVGWGIALGIGVADAIWGDAFYEFVQKKLVK